MDKSRADSLLNEIFGKSIDGWEINSLLGFGNTAAVFGASKDGKRCAVKVYDALTFDCSSGGEAEVRLERQLSLREHFHPNLVAILGGGRTRDLGPKETLYLLMDVHAATLETQLLQIPRDHIGHIVAGIALACRHLDERGIVHRDIKPGNIAYDIGTRKVTVLDLGVIKWTTNALEADITGSGFVGTLRYAPPEFALRIEEQTREGYRALTIYQIGGVMHDLIMGQRLYAEFSGAALAKAIGEIPPRVFSRDVDPQLIQIAELCLLPDPVERIRYVDWEKLIRLGDSAILHAMPAKERLAQWRAAPTVAHRRLVTRGLNGCDMDEIDRISQMVTDALRAEVVAQNQIFPAIEFLARSPEKADLNRPFEIVLEFAAFATKSVPRGLKLTYEFTTARASNVLTVTRRMTAPKAFEVQYGFGASEESQLCVFQGRPSDREVVRQVVEDLYTAYAQVVNA